MSNVIRFCGTQENAVEFLKSNIESSQNVINHYDFVINDISSDISDPKLQATKGPALHFPQEMRAKWITFQSDLKVQLSDIEKGNLV